MEQHLLAYLTTKYGVRQLITQWLTSILAAVEHFAPLDSQTALFGKVLRNEVEEEFEEAQLRVITTANSLLHSILQVTKQPPLQVQLDITSLHPHLLLPPSPPPNNVTLPAPPCLHFDLLSSVQCNGTILWLLITILAGPAVGSRSQPVV